jgi:surface antigen/chitodextrinase
MRRVILILCTIASALYLATSSGLATTAADGIPQQAAASQSRGLPVWPTLRTTAAGRYEVGIAFTATTRPRAHCTLAVRAGQQKLRLPTVEASGGQARWHWVIGSGAPGGRWHFVVRCARGRLHGSARLHPLVLVPKDQHQASIMDPGSLSITAGQPVKRLHRQSRHLPKASPHGGRGGAGLPNPGYNGYCTWGAWNLARWLGYKVHGDAKYWYPTARASGLPTGTVPVAGAVFVHTSGAFGHVGVVTKVINSTTFQAREMNGGRIWVNAAQGITNEFNEYRLHVHHTGANMYFIYKPGTEPGALRRYVGHIVQWSGDKSPQKAAWLVGSDLHRRWIPDIATYNCLKSKGAPGPDVLPASVLDRLPDLKGVHATCTKPQPKVQTPPVKPPPPLVDSTPPSKPSGLKVSSVATTALTLSWSASTDNVGVTGYDVYRNGSRVARPGGRSYRYTGLACGHSYKLGVAAHDAAGNHSSTATVTGSTAHCPPTTHSEQASVHHPVHTFRNYHNASGQGPDIATGKWVKVSCKVHDPTIVSVNPDGYWYRIADSPWSNAYYAPANSFMNGDPPNGPYTHNTDFSVPNC